MMRPGSLIRSSLLIVLCGVFTQAFAQRFEVYPYVGYTFPAKLFGLEFKNSGVFGVKAGVITDSGWEVGGNLGRMSRFELEGMTRQLDALSNMGLLSRFVGMLTDSRSFLSYSRHEYFRRLLCNILGSDVKRGLLPDDRQLLGEMVTDICFRNARDYFGLELPAVSASR